MEMKDKFKVIKALEDWRWGQDIKEYAFETSFYHFNETDDKFKEEEIFKKYFQLNNEEHQDINKSLAEKILLTHYLVYICDRQMDYRHIFKAGGYVISHLVEEYLRLKNTNEFKWNKIFKLCRIKNDNSYSYFLYAPIEKNNDEIFNYFLNREKIINEEGQIMTRNKGQISVKKIKTRKSKNDVVTDNDINDKKYEFIPKLETKKKNNYYAIFSSRYMLQDIGCMYKTLSCLSNDIFPETSKNNNIKRIISGKNYNYSFCEFLREHSNNNICTYSKNNKIASDTSGLARALYELTYQCIPQIAAEDNIQDFDKLLEYIKGKMNENYSNKKKDFLIQNNRYSLKRMWCIIRDFLINPVFRECFRVIINKDDIKFDFTENKKFIELPGDVWNNNSTFTFCFWKDYIEAYEDIDSFIWENIKSSKFVRERYNKAIGVKGDAIDAWGDCKPIDFDITFRFVPRMCEEDNWDICPLYDKDNQNSCKRKLDSINCESNENDWQNKICHEKPKEKTCEEKSNEKTEDNKRKDSKLCPLALYSCGIKHECNNCDL